jgi:hypothetical protein
MAEKSVPTAEMFRKHFRYEPDTGNLYWIGRTGGRVVNGMLAGSFNAYGYRTVMVGHRNYPVHRVAWTMMTGTWPDGEIDHRDLNRANNKWDNLRVATRAQNSHNYPKRKDNTTGFKGVVFAKHAKKFMARICINSKGHHLGYFNTAEEAHEAYCKAATAIRGEFARFE